MRSPRVRARRDERGASLILAIAFLVVIGGIGGGVVSAVTSGVNDRTVLDHARDREYAADGAVEFAITQVRQLGAPGPAVADCGPSNHYLYTLNAIHIWVDCSNQRTLVDRLLQRNVVFTACVDTGSPCTDATTVVRAQVNFQAQIAGDHLDVTRSWVQSWSVNG
jgi:hypothetical protein